MARKRSPLTGIVGLDLSLNGTGFARIDRSNGDVETRTFSTKPGDGTIVERSRTIGLKILNLIKPGDIVFVEGYAFGIKANASSAITLAELGGIVKLLVLQYTGVEPLIITTSEMRKFISGSGNIKKEVIPVHTFKKYNRECHSHDECVALVLADIGDHIISYAPLFDYVADKKQEEIVRRLRSKYAQELQSISGTIVYGEKNP